VVSVGGLNFFVEEDAATELKFGDFSNGKNLVFKNKKVNRLP
jgi:hypothetical protein